MSDEERAEELPSARNGSPMPAWFAAGLAVLVVMFGIGAAYVIGTNHAPEASAAPATAPADPTQTGLLVSGTGTATGVPDQLRFTVTVRHSAADVVAAMNATSADTRNVVHALTAKGIAKQDIRTAGVSVQPTYRYSGGQELISGYAASERVSVKVRDLKIAGSVIAATATAAGNATRIGGITMSVADPSTLQKQARTQAIADAKVKAEQFAEATGRKLGAVVEVDETQPVNDYTNQRSAFASLDTAQALKVPISPGTQTTRVDVTVRWSFA